MAPSTSRFIDGGEDGPKSRNRDTPLAKVGDSYPGSWEPRWIKICCKNLSFAFEYSYVKRTSVTFLYGWVLCRGSQWLINWEKMPPAYVRSSSVRASCEEKIENMLKRRLVPVVGCHRVSRPAMESRDGAVAKKLAVASIKQAEAWWRRKKYCSVIVLLS